MEFSKELVIFYMNVTKSIDLFYYLINYTLIVEQLKIEFVKNKRH